MLSLYLAKAFDCIPHELLLAKVKAYGVAEHGVALLRNYLCGRSHRVRSRRQVSFLAAGYKREYLRDPSQLDPFSSMHLPPAKSLFD